MQTRFLYSLAKEQKMQKLYTEIEAIISKIDFNAIWKGFKPCNFVLYDKNSVFFKDKKTPWDNRFMGNTAIEINGEQTAIWGVSNPDNEDAELLAMGIVHEMFHAFQNQQGENRRIDEFAMFTYPRDTDNYHMKMAEIHYLIKAFGENSDVDFEQFAVLRRARKHIIGDALRQELLAETFEGMAEYAGMMALRQISHKKFMEQLENQLIYVRNPENLFNTRRISYYVGSILCMTLKALGMNFHHNLSESRPLFDLIKWKPTVIDESLEKFQKDMQKRFEDFKLTHVKKIEKSALITGFDPMNMERLDDEILCKNFVVLDDEFIQGPVLLIMEKDSLRRVKGYIK